MRVLLTGGTGFIGSAVLAELVGAGHSVLALARSQASAERLADAGAVPLRGSLEDCRALRDAASECDAAIHLAFPNGDPRSFRRSARSERAALAAMAEGLWGSGGLLVAAGGLAPVRPRHEVAVESDPVSRRRGLTGRNVELTLGALAEKGAGTAVVRLPAVHGPGDRFTVR